MVAIAAAQPTPAASIRSFAQTGKLISTPSSRQNPGGASQSVTSTQTSPFESRKSTECESLRLVIATDELAFFTSSDMRPQDAETLHALRPTLATTGGRLVVLSSPYGQSGALWDLFRRHHGRDDAPVLVWQADAPTMNPTLPRDYLHRMEEEDPEAYRCEVLGEFRAGLSRLLDPDAIEACVPDRPLEHGSADAVRYVAFVDPSGGRRDAFTCAIGHRDGERFVVDAVRA